MNSVTIKIGGEAGFGIITAGTMLSKTFARLGYYTFVTNEYPSLIRGGHNVVTVRISTEKFASMNRDLHILVALNKQTIDLHKEELSKDAITINEPAMNNTMAIGAVLAVLGIPLEALHSVIKDQFSKKGDDIVNANIEAAKKGYDTTAKKNSFPLEKIEKKEDQLLLNASEATGMGAARAELKFAAIYPMTPINALITFLADHVKQLQLTYIQPEDEIAGINMAIGASLGGVRSMVATSGGGFALMVEGLSWAGMIEAPLVIDLGMRPGPSTGMPTYSEQGELQFVIHAGHGEFPRIVLAPATAEEAYQLTIDAFNLADRYQVPVFILTDKYINESTWCVPKSVFSKAVIVDRGKIRKDIPTDGSFKRYDLSVTDGISSRSFPGQKGGFYIANSYEHDEVGYMTDKAESRVAMANKRIKKFEAMKKDMMPPQVFGDTDAEITFVTWGSTRGPVLDAMKLLPKKSRLVHYSWLYPFPAEETIKLLSPATRIIDVEQNATGQLASLIREHTGIFIKEKLLKYDGRPFFLEEIVEYVNKS